MYCAETSAEAEEGWEYFHNQLTGRPAPLLRVEQPGFRRDQGVRGVPRAVRPPTSAQADASLASRPRDTSPSGRPDEIIDKIKTLQWAISLETLVIHVFYGGMPQEKAEKSLRLFAEKVLPAVQAMATPMNPASLGPLGQLIVLSVPPERFSIRGAGVEAEVSGKGPNLIWGHGLSMDRDERR